MRSQDLDFVPALCKNPADVLSRASSASPNRRNFVIQNQNSHQCTVQFALNSRGNSASQWQAYKIRFYYLQAPTSKSVCNNTGYTATHGNSKHYFPRKMRQLL